MIRRGEFLRTLGLAAATPWLARAATPEPFTLRYILASALYGELPLADILPEVAKTGCEAIDLWCRPHGSQREQAAALGDEAFAALLRAHQVRLGSSTRYPLGPTGLKDELAWTKQLGGELVITGSRPPSEPSGAAAKAAVRDFLELMKPHVARAEDLGVTIAIENHDKQLLFHPDALRYFAEFNRSPRLGVAFAPHHLHRWADQIPALIRDLGARQIPFLYCQEHSEGIRKQVPKAIELQQLPGFGGGLDYRPILRALRDIRYTGLVEIFMHPTPRGIPILPTIPEVTAAVNRARDYLERCRREILT